MTAATGRGRRAGHRLWLGLTVTGIVLLAVSWIGTTRPFGGPDEPAHYLRALTISQGVLLGPRATYRDPAFSPSQQAWQKKDSRGVEVAARLAPVATGVVSAQPQTCVDGRPDVPPGRCEEATYTGDYPPLTYLLPAAAIGLSHSADTGLWIARVVSCLLSVAFLISALMALPRLAGWSQLGFLLALTPMAMFIDGVLNPSGLETAASFAMAASTLRLVRGEPAPRWIWVLLAASVVAVTLAWQLGPAFVVVDILLALMLRRRPESSRLRPLTQVGLTLGAALVLWVIWDVISGVGHANVRVTLSGLGVVPHQIYVVLQEWFGDFGWLTAPMPKGLFVVWLIVVVLLIAGAICLGSWRQRIALAIVCFIAVAFPALFYVWAYESSGFSLQARYVMPILILAPMLAGYIFDSAPALQRLGRWSPMLVGAGTVLAAIFDLAGWWRNASAQAYAPGAFDRWLTDGHLWHPPGTWWPWLALAVAGALAIAASGMLRAGDGLMARLGAGDGLMVRARG